MLQKWKVKKFWKAALNLHLIIWLCRFVLYMLTITHMTLYIYKFVPNLGSFQNNYIYIEWSCPTQC